MVDRFEKRIAVTLRNLLYIVFALASIVARASNWNPGGNVEGWPHVRMGEYEGIYVPEEGWRFTGNYPDDLSTAILDEPGFTQPATDGGVLHIPAPKGYWTPTPGTSLEQICLAWAANHVQEPVLHMWVRLDSKHGLIVVSIGDFAALRGQNVGLSDFLEFKEKCFNEVLYSHLQEGYLDKYTTFRNGEKVEKTYMNCFGAESDIHIAFSTRRHHEFTASGVAFDSSVSMAYALLKGQIIAFAARTYDQNNLSGAALQCERDLERWVAIAEKENSSHAKLLLEKMIPFFKIVGWGAGIALVVWLVIVMVRVRHQKNHPEKRTVVDMASQGVNDSGMICPYCNRDNPKDAVHCMYCGREFSSVETAQEEKNTRGLWRYLFAILACVAIFVFYIFLNILLGWKRGGGMVVVALLLAALSGTWHGITKD